MNRLIIDEIYSLRMQAGVLSSRGRNSDSIDDKLTTMFAKYPNEYKQADKEIYADIEG